MENDPNNAEVCSAPGARGEPAADEAGKREQHDRDAAADGAALQAEQQEMPLEFGAM